jgi:tetratricopeptide (TPR) repeat protein
MIKVISQDAALQSQDDPDQYHLVSFLTTAPEPLRDADLALKLARRAVELKPGDAMCLQALGDAMYRTGDFQSSLEAIKKTGATEKFAQAMALWQLREKTEANAIIQGERRLPTRWACIGRPFAVSLPRDIMSHRSSETFRVRGGCHGPDDLRISLRAFEARTTWYER